MGLPVEDGMRSPWRGVGWFCLWCGAGVVGLGVVWGSWYGVAKGRLGRELAAMRGRGEATNREELVGRGGEGKSGYDIAIEASGALSLDGDEAEFVSPSKAGEQTSLPLDQQQIALGRRMLDENEKVLEMVEGLRTAKWEGYPIPASLTTWSVPSSGRVRILASFLRVAALVHHSMRDEEAAADDLEKTELLARVVGDGPFLIPQLVSMGVRSVGEDGWMQIAPDLRLQDAAHPRGLSRERWMREIELYGDRGEATRGMAKAFVGERAMMLALEGEAEGRVPHLVPMLRLDAARTSEKFEEMIEEVSRGANFVTAGGAADWPACRSNVMGLTHSIEVDQPGMRNVVKLYYRTVCSGDAVAIRLALRLYALEHDGEAERLGELAPGYLKKVPVDLFRGDGREWGYSREKGEFWSVNDDGVDDGGEGTRRHAGQMVDWRGKDMCIWLERGQEGASTTVGGRRVY